MARLMLEAIVSDVTGAFENPRSVWLFGSRRHGDATETSDVDLIVDGEIGTRRAAVSELLGRHHGFVDLFVLQGNGAVSADSGCTLCAESPEALLEKVGAELVWQSGPGWVGSARARAFVVDVHAAPARTNNKKRPRQDARAVPLQPGPTETRGLDG